MTVGTNSSAHLYDTTFNTNGALYSAASGVVTSTSAGAAGTVFAGSAGAPSFTATPTVTSISFGGSALGTYSAFTSYSPVIAFNGGSTGITYSTQNGGYLQIGSLVWFFIDLHLSSKGSSTGNATCTLPLTLNASVSTVDFIWYAPLGTFTAGTTYCIAEVGAGSSSLALYQVNGSTGIASNITNASFGGTDFVRISGTYLH